MTGILNFDTPEKGADALAKEMGQRFPDVEVSAAGDRRLEVKAGREDIKQLCKFIRDELSFEHIVDLAGMDYRKNLEIVYHVNSYRNHCIAEIRVEVPNDDPSIDTVSDVWIGANWHEREVLDMFGITFNGHPDLRRILLPDDADFHPLLKSFKMKKKDGWNVEMPSEEKGGGE